MLEELLERGDTGAVAIKAVLGRSDPAAQRMPRLRIVGQAYGDGDIIVDCLGDRLGNAHHLQNRSDAPAVYYDVGGRDAWDVSTFPDIGLETRPHIEVRFREIGKKA